MNGNLLFDAKLFFPGRTCQAGARVIGFAAKVVPKEALKEPKTNEHG
jgi:hypothetical protein